VIRTLDFMGLPQKPKPLPLEPTPWGSCRFGFPGVLNIYICLFT